MGSCWKNNSLLLSPLCVSIYLTLMPSCLEAQALPLMPPKSKNTNPLLQAGQLPETRGRDTVDTSKNAAMLSLEVATNQLPLDSKAAPSAENSDLIVTAERRSENVQNIGSSISVLSGDTLTTRNVNNVFDLQYQTPSLQVTPQFGSGQPAFAIRGVGFNDYSSNNAPTVGIYIDEVANPVPFATNGMMFDIQRVEVLRGPQGTLYGRNTTGGAINYILNKPTDTYKGGLSVQYGRFNATKIDGYVSGPINDRLRFRLSGQTEQGGAWQHNEQGASLGRTNRSAARFLLDYDANDTLKLELNIHGSHDRSDANGLHLYAPMTALPGQTYPADQSRYMTHWGTSSAFAREVGIHPNTKPFSHIDTGGVSLRSEQEFSFATLTDIFSYDRMHRWEYDNFDAFNQGLADVAFKTNAQVFANEIRLTSNDTSRLTWVGGIYYAHQSLSDQYQSGFTDSPIYGTDGDVNYDQRVNTISGFGQATYHITPQLRVTGGVRIEHESRDLLNLTSHYITNGVITNPENGVAHRNTSFTKPTGKFEIQYNPVSNDMIYVSFTRGVKSGGFTTYNSQNDALSAEPFKPESLLAYEIGNKLSLPEAHLKLNISGFYYDYRNQQIQSATFNTMNGGMIGQIVNAPRSHLYGGEVEATWTPIPNFTLSQSAGWAVGAFDRFSSLGGVQKLADNAYAGIYVNRKGDTLPFPKFTLNGSASYRWTIGDFYLTTGMNYSRRSPYHSLFGSFYNVPAYTLWGADITLTPKDARWTVAVFGKNIFNKRYDVTRNFFISGDHVALAGMPATWGVRVSGSF